MTPYYTTSAGYNQPQREPFNSLGGYKSAYTVKNDDFDNLFGEISLLKIRNNSNEYAAIILRNETGADITNVQAWLGVPESSYANFQIAAVMPTTDQEGNPVMERVRTRNTKPFTGEFIDTDEENKAVLGATIAAGAEIGIWFKRSLRIDEITEEQANIYERDPDNINLYREIELGKADSIEFFVSWD